MDTDKPFIEKVILPKFLYKLALSRGKETSSEVGFYIIGLIRNKIAYCYDLIEFDYYEQGPTYLETNFAKDFRLRASLPIGLKILGNMHKHPGKMLSYSSTDKQTFTRYARDSHNKNVFIIYVVEPDELQAYSATEENIFKIEIEIRNFMEEEQIKNFYFTIPITFQVCGPKNSIIQNMRFNFISEASYEVSKCLSRPIFMHNFKEISDKEQLMNVSEIEVVPYIPIDIKLGHNYRIAYRFYLPANAKVEDLHEKLIKEFKIFSNLRLFLGNNELDEKQRLNKLVGKVLELKEMQIREKFDNNEVIEKITISINNLRKEIDKIATQNKNLKLIEEEFVKIYKFLNDLESRLEKLEGKRKENSKTKLDDFMRYG